MRDDGNVTSEEEQGGMRECTKAITKERIMVRTMTLSDKRQPSREGDRERANEKDTERVRRKRVRERERKREGERERG